MNLFWEYTRTGRFHWVSDGKYYNMKKSKWGKMYEFKLWAIVDCADYGSIHQKEGGYDLYYKGRKIKHSDTVKELKLFADRKEKKPISRNFSEALGL